MRSNICFDFFFSSCSHNIYILIGIRLFKVFSSSYSLWNCCLFNMKKDDIQLAQPRCDNVVTTPLLTLSQRCGTVENESCTDVSFRRCDKIALRCFHNVATTSRQHYALDFWAILPRTILISFPSSKRDRVTNVLSGIKDTLFLFKRTLYL